MTEPEKKPDKQQGLSKEAWAAISAIAVALIGGIFNVVTTMANKPSSPSSSSSPSPSGSAISPSSSPAPSEPPTPSPSIPAPVSTHSPSSSTPAQRLEQALGAVNIYLDDQLRSRDYLTQFHSQYPQFARGCLKLLSDKRLRKKASFEVIFNNYTEKLKGYINKDADAGDLNTEILKTSILDAFNSENGSNALSFGDIVEPR